MDDAAAATIVLVGRADPFTAALAGAFAAERRRIAVLHDGDGDYAAVLASEVARRGAICLPLTIGEVQEERRLLADAFLNRVGEAFGRLDAIARIDLADESDRGLSATGPIEAPSGFGVLPDVPALMQAARSLPRALRRSVRRFFRVVADDQQRTDGAGGAPCLSPGWGAVGGAASARSAPGVTALLLPRAYVDGVEAAVLRALAERVLQGTSAGGAADARAERLVGGPEGFRFEAAEFS